MGRSTHNYCGPGSSVGISDWLRARRSGDRIPVGARFSAPVHTGSGAHPASCTMGTGTLPGVKSGQGVTLTPHPLLVPWSRKSIAIPLLTLWAVRPVQSLSACTRVNFTFTFTPLRCSWCIFVPSYFLLLNPVVLLNILFFSTETVHVTSLNCKFSVNREFILYSSFLFWLVSIGAV